MTLSPGARSRMRSWGRKRGRFSIPGTTGNKPSRRSPGRTAPPIPGRKKSYGTPPTRNDPRWLSARRVCRTLSAKSSPGECSPGSADWTNSPARVKSRRPPGLLCSFQSFRPSITPCFGAIQTPKSGSQKTATGQRLRPRLKGCFRPRPGKSAPSWRRNTKPNTTKSTPSINECSGSTCPGWATTRPGMWITAATSKTWR